MCACLCVLCVNMYLVYIMRVCLFGKCSFKYKIYSRLPHTYVICYHSSNVIIFVYFFCIYLCMYDIPILIWTEHDTEYIFLFGRNINIRERREKMKVKRHAVIFEASLGTLTISIWIHRNIYIYVLYIVVHI